VLASDSSDWPKEAVSFTDDTSPDTRNGIQRYVSIQANVKRKFPLTWYYDLIKPFEKDRRAELKSRDILPVYRTLSAAQRAILWETLKNVQINITDALPYQEQTKQSANRAFKRDDAIDFIRQKAIANDPTAKILLEMLNNHTAESILLDAPSRHLSSLAFYARQFPFGGYGFGRYMRSTGLGFPEPPDHEIPLAKFQSRRPGSIVRTVTAWTAQSAVVFSEAIDSVSFNGFYHHHPLLDPVQRALRRSHAFDDGHKNLVCITNEERRSVAKKLSRFNHGQENYPFGRLYDNLDSRQSFYIQACDIAAGIARHLYENGSILAVALNFDYVMFNGKRISQSEAYETMEEWRQSGYIN
jgi:hypothetical protein